MPTIAYDMMYLEAGLDELDSYLLSDHLYWSTGASAPRGEPEFPSLTLGGLLLAHQRLRAHRLDPSLEHAFQDLHRRLEYSQARWRVAWGRKSQRSFHARLNQWNNYLSDYLSQPEVYADQYPQEVRIRLMLDLLQPLADHIDPSELDLLHSLDALLHVRLLPGEFVWEKDLAEGFPQAQYWYLYGHLKE
ncbi:MAG: hypothetical protein MUC85_04150 [Anaerolineales bacterium]|jgi:hypothetical protein|nr:hypothetical protein [Anaerolineales bacterium]